MDLEAHGHLHTSTHSHTAAVGTPGGEADQSKHTISSTSGDEHKTMQRIRDQESFTTTTKWLTIHGFRQGMTDEQVLHTANTICGNMQLQMNNEDIAEDMNQNMGWQVIAADVMSLQRRYC